MSWLQPRTVTRPVRKIILDGHPYYTRWGGPDPDGRWFSDCSCHRFTYSDTYEEAVEDFKKHVWEAHGRVWPDEDEANQMEGTKEFLSQ